MNILRFLGHSLNGSNKSSQLVFGQQSSFLRDDVANPIPNPPPLPNVGTGSNPRRATGGVILKYSVPDLGLPDKISLLAVVYEHWSNYYWVHIRISLKVNADYMNNKCHEHRAREVITKLLVAQRLPRDLKVRDSIWILLWSTTLKPNRCRVYFSFL